MSHCTRLQNKTWSVLSLVLFSFTDKQIRDTLTSRFNDILYRKERGYAEIIAEKRNEMQQAFDAGFAVLNPLAQMNFYEQTFTDPKSKPSEKFKAINDAEKLKARLFGESPKKSPAERAEALNTYQIKNLREKLYDIIDTKRLAGVYSTLSDTLKEKIKTTANEERIGHQAACQWVLHDEGRSMRHCSSDPRMTDMPPHALIALSDRLLHGRSNDLSIEEIDALIDKIIEVSV